MILREAAGKFKGRTILAAEGNTRRIDPAILDYEVVTDFTETPTFRWRL